jgi:hypothetical protein
MQTLLEMPAVTINSTIDPIVYIKYLFSDEGITKTPIVDFVRQVETVYKGLGIPSLYGALSILANKNVLFIGGTGLGKTRLINCIPDFESFETSKWDSFTLGEFNEYIAKREEEKYEGIKGKHFVFKVEEFSTLSEYHRDIFMTVCSKITSDHNYSHVSNLTPNLKIIDCKLTMLIAIQPILYSKLSTFYPQWHSMSSDRFTKFVLLNPLRENTTDDDLTMTFPKKIPPMATIDESIDLSQLVELFRSQVSEGRAFLYARDYAIAIARFQGKSKVTQSDVNLFYKLFNVYLETFSRLQVRDGLDRPITVPSGSLELMTEVGKHFNGITKQELARKLLVLPVTIMRGLEFPIQKGLIKQTDNQYYLSDDLLEFFIWYKATFSSQKSEVV